MLISQIHLTDDYGNKIIWPCWMSYKAAMHFLMDDAVDYNETVSNADWTSEC